ncbi:hypothetical protein [uncultured Polaribacter sp.]|uniref:hypothetical protein n=1 Tax=uncultured Polaribacter sp. TaxID=174711 RepID=UPI002612BF55|nr:hypothetical protein [uncultured Polaribacter sp.]
MVKSQETLLPKNRMFQEQRLVIWIKKYNTLVQQNTGMSKNDEIKKMKEKTEKFEFVKDFRQDIFANMEIFRGVDMSKKSLPKTPSCRQAD